MSLLPYTACLHDRRCFTARSLAIADSGFRATSPITAHQHTAPPDLETLLLQGLNVANSFLPKLKTRSPHWKATPLASTRPRNLRVARLILPPHPAGQLSALPFHKQDGILTAKDHSYDKNPRSRGRDSPSPLLLCVFSYTRRPSANPLFAWGSFHCQLRGYLPVHSWVSRSSQRGVLLLVCHRWVCRCLLGGKNVI